MIVRYALLMIAAVTGNSLHADETPLFPIRASGDGRFLVNAKNRPFFYNADTAWTITKKLKRSEIEEYLDNCRASGFNTVHIHTFSKEQGPLANVAGELPFDASEDILKPNEAYWKNVDLIIEAARRRNLLVAMSAIWIRWGGRDKEGWRYKLTEANARAYGQFLGKRYRSFPNLMWILGGDANPVERLRAIAALAGGIRELAPGQLITVHNRSMFSSSAFFESEKWLDINMAYTYEDPWNHVAGEYMRLGRTRPIVFGESGYEQESNDKRGGDPARMRRQAYVAVLAGSLGGQAFGNRSVWRFAPDWRDALSAPGRRQMRHVKTLFTERALHRLQPDVFDELIVAGKGHPDTPGYVAAARTPDGTLGLAYFPETRTIALDSKRLAGPFKARWFDPTDGSYREIEGNPKEFTPPAKNAAGDSDFVLVLETIR